MFELEYSLEIYNWFFGIIIIELKFNSLISGFVTEFQTVN